MKFTAIYYSDTKSIPGLHNFRVYFSFCSLTNLLFCIKNNETIRCYLDKDNFNDTKSICAKLENLNDIKQLFCRENIDAMFGE